MADPANFGMAKAVFSMPMSDPDGNPLADIGELIESGLDPDSAEFQAAIRRRLDEFNALPFEQRAAITDPSLGGAVPRTGGSNCRWSTCHRPTTSWPLASPSRAS